MGYRLQILVNNKYEDVELNDKFSISFNYTVKDFNSPSDIKTGYSKTITIEGTPHNNKILANIYSLNSVYVTVDPNKKIDCILSYNGMLVRTGYIVINSITKQGHSVSYKCTMYDDTTKLLYDIKYDKDGNERTLDSLNLGFDDEYDTYEYGFRYAMDSWSRFGNLTGPNNILYEPTMDVSNSIKSFITPIYGYTGLYDDFDSSHVLVQCQDKYGIPYSFNTESEAVKPPLYLDANTKSYDVTKTKPLFGEKLAVEQKEDGNTVLYSNLGGWYTYEIERELHPNEARTIIANRLPLGIDLGKTWDIICSNFNIDDSDVYDKVHEIFDNTFMMLDVKKVTSDKPTYYYTNNKIIKYPEKSDLGIEDNLLYWNCTHDYYGSELQNNYDINKLYTNTGSEPSTRRYIKRVSLTPSMIKDSNIHIKFNPILTSKYKSSEPDREFVKTYHTASTTTPNLNGKEPIQMYTTWSNEEQRTRLRLADYIHHFNIIIYLIDIQPTTWPTQTRPYRRIAVPVIGNEVDSTELRDYIEDHIGLICTNLTHTSSSYDGKAISYVEKSHIFSQLYLNEKYVDGTELRYKDLDVYIKTSDLTFINEDTDVTISVINSHVLLPWTPNVINQDILPIDTDYTGVIRNVDNVGYYTDGGWQEIPSETYVNYFYKSDGRTDGQRYMRMIIDGEYKELRINPYGFLTAYNTYWTSEKKWWGYFGGAAYRNKQAYWFYSIFQGNYMQLQGSYLIRKRFYPNGDDNYVLENYELTTNIDIRCYEGSEELTSATINKGNTLNTTKVFDTFINMCKLLNITCINDSYSINRNLKCVFANNLYDSLRVVDITKDIEYNLAVTPTVLESGVYEYSLNTILGYADTLRLGINPKYNKTTVNFDYDIVNTPIDVFESLDFKSVSKHNLNSTWFNPPALEIKSSGGDQLSQYQYNATNKGYQIKQTLYKQDNTTKEIKTIDIESGGLMYNVPANSNYIQNVSDEFDYICLFDKDLKNADFSSALVSVNNIRTSSYPITIAEDIPAEKQILNKFCYPLYIKRDTTSIKQNRVLWDINTNVYKNADDLYFEAYTLPEFSNYKNVTRNNKITGEPVTRTLMLGCTNLDGDNYSYENPITNIYNTYFKAYYSYMLSKNNKKLKVKVRLNSYDIIQILTSIYYLDNSYWVIIKLNNFDVTKEYNEVELVQIDYAKYLEVKNADDPFVRKPRPDQDEIDWGNIMPLSEGDEEEEDECRIVREDNPFEDLTPEPIENGES